MSHFGHHCPHAQCYSCNEFSHFAQDCPNKIPPSGKPCHQDRSPSRQWYTHTWRNWSHATHYGHRHGRHSNWSQSHQYSHQDRSSSSFIWRHTLHSSSSHCSGFHCPLADGCPPCHSCQDTLNRHSHTPCHTPHLSHWCHLFHYSKDWSQLHSINSPCSAQETQLIWKDKPCWRPSTPHKSYCSKTFIIQDSPLDSSSDSDNDSDPLCY